MVEVIRTSVQSSYCRALGHNRHTNELHVEWPSGKISVYSDVTPEQYASILGAESVGRAVIEIKKTRSHRYL